RPRWRNCGSRVRVSATRSSPEWAASRSCSRTRPATRWSSSSRPDAKPGWRGHPEPTGPWGFKRRPEIVTLDHVYDYDVLVIGSGPGGQKAAIAAAKLERRVGIVERKDMIGGVCLNTGTIPSKTLREGGMYLRDSS